MSVDWTSAVLSAADLAARSEGLPLILPRNLLAGATVSWITDLGADDTDAAWPGSRAVDGYAHGGRHTQPATAASPRLIAFVCPSTITIDSVILWGSNLDGATAITVYVADSGGLLTAIGTLPVPSYGDGRCVSLALYHTGSTARAYTGDTFAIGIETAPAIKPKVREAWFGRRVQLPRWPSTPFEDQAVGGVAGGAETLEGYRYRVRHAVGQAARNVAMDLAEASEQALAERVYNESSGLADPLVWIEGATPRAYLMRSRDRAHDPRNQAGGRLRSWELDLIEQPPFMAYEGIA